MAMDLNGKDIIAELIKCPICLEIYTDPRMLPCQHSFCRGCLERLAENDGRWGRCPQCRQLFRIPFNGVGSFDVNRTVAQLLETFSNQQAERPVLRAKCGACRKEETITTCEHCKEALCKPCRVAHFNEVKSGIDTQLVKIECDSEMFLVKEVECVSKHESNLLKCQEIRMCIQKKVADIVQRVKDEETKLLDDVDDFERIETSLLNEKNVKIKELEAISKFGSASIKRIDGKEEADEEVMDMHVHCDKYVHALNECAQDLQTRYMTRRISFFDRDIADNLFSLGYVETVSQQDGAGSFFSDDDAIIAAAAAAAAAVAAGATNAGAAGTNNFGAADEKYETLEMQLKQIPRRNASVMRKGRYVPGASVPSLKLSGKTRFKSIIEPRKLFQPYKIIGSEGEDTAEFKHPLGVAVSPIDGHIYVADSWNNRIQIFDENGVHIKSVDKIGQFEFHYPYSIHIDKKGRIYVSDQSLMRIKLFDSNFNFLKLIGHYGREIGCYSGLCDISTDRHNNIYICDSGNHRILKFSENGEFLLQWGSNGNTEGLFKCPACVTVHQETVIVSDWGNHRVQIFTLDGKYLDQIGKQGTGPGEFKRPLGVAVDERGNIAIVDEGNNRLQLFRADFSYHSKLTGLKCDFQRPWDVAITKQGGIVVSEYYGHRLQIL